MQCAWTYIRTRTIRPGCGGAEPMPGLSDRAGAWPKASALLVARAVSGLIGVDRQTEALRATPRPSATT